jgi:hypothetical protein
MKLIAKRGIPTDVDPRNPAISNDKLIIVGGLVRRGAYSYATKKWFWIEQFYRGIPGLEGDDELIWFEVEN